MKITTKINYKKLCSRVSFHIKRHGFSLDFIIRSNNETLAEHCLKQKFFSQYQKKSIFFASIIFPEAYDTRPIKLTAQR